MMRRAGGAARAMYFRHLSNYIFTVAEFKSVGTT